MRWILIVLAGWLLVQPALAREGRFYVLTDEQYYKPMLANIRTPVNHLRLYRDEAVRFSNSTRPGDHTFWDVAYGGFFPLAGIRFDTSDPDNPMRRSGLALFVSGSAHVLLDFDTQSSDVINNDYRLGAGVALRFPGSLGFLSLRYRFFHESSHVGDEFTLSASDFESFRRYNVSYEANELYAAVDHYREADGLLGFSYLRLYGGGRVKAKEALFEDFRDRDPALALKTADRNEVQVGGELLFKGWERPWLFLLPQYFAVAGEGYRRDRYALLDPEKVWSVNVAGGIIFGRYFQSDRTVRWLVNYYKGVHPHGQFRTTEIEYVGIDLSISF